MKVQTHQVVKYTNGIRDYDVLFPVIGSLVPRYPDTLSYYDEYRQTHFLLARKV